MKSPHVLNPFHCNYPFAAHEVVFVNDVVVAVVAVAAGKGCRDTQYNDTEHYDHQYNDNQHDDI
jgi:hypothetical protein